MSKLLYKVLSENLGVALESMVSSARQRVLLVAPFITKRALERIVAKVPPDIGMLILTRWQVDEVAVGASDPGILDLANERLNCRILLHAQLHAKIYIVDTQAALVGSANITETALGYARQPNVEVLLQLEPVPTSLFVYVQKLVRTGIEASHILRCQIEKAAQELHQAQAILQIPHALISTPAMAIHASNLFPSFRTPGRLYDLYLSMETLHHPEDQDTVINDLMYLSIPDGLDEQSFRTEVKKRLDRIPEMIDFGCFVTQPRRFGEMTDWLKKRIPELADDHEKCQRYLQTLIRWLLFFFPDRYELTQRRYTEIFRQTRGIHAI